MRRLVFPVWVAAAVVCTGVAVADDQPRGTTGSRDRQTTEREHHEHDAAKEIQQNSYLKAKIQPMLPAKLDAVTAAQGFDDVDDFVASVNVAKNQNISYDQFKQKVLSDEIDGNLEKALRAMKPRLSEDMAEKEVAKAKQQAEEQIKGAKQEQQAARGERKGIDRRKGTDRTDEDTRPVPGRP